MSGVTAEQARAAAEVLRVFQFPPNVWTQGESETMGRSARILDDIAKRLESEQAEKAKRDKRIAELAAIIDGTYAEVSKHYAPGWFAWKKIAEAIVDAHLSLLDETGATS